MILNDQQILSLAEAGMISNFVPTQVRRGSFTAGVHDEEYSFPTVSHGLSSFGYDIRLSSREFKVFQRLPGEVLDPKRFNPQHLHNAVLKEDDFGKYFILPGNSYGLGVAVEGFDLPNDIVAICLGKSTYARCGIIVNVTPAEPGWKGHLTLEFSNSSEADCRIYADEGVAQVLFFQGKPCITSYADRQGKYRGQGHEVVLPTV